MDEDRVDVVLREAVEDRAILLPPIVGDQHGIVLLAPRTVRLV
jgi:hypothetical protein